MQALPQLLPPPILPDGSQPPERNPEKTQNLIRFQAELEFVQCLSNPLYLRELSIQGYLTKPEFLNYLKYLQYWRKSEYVRFLTYPTCLIYLTLLLQPTFRERLGDPVFVAELMRIGSVHHETWRINKSSSDQPQPGA